MLPLWKLADKRYLSACVQLQFCNVFCDAMIARYAIATCLSVCLSQPSVLYPNGRTD